MGEDLTRDLYYLTVGRRHAGGVVVLDGPDGRWAPLFTSRAAATAMADAAPAGVRIGYAPAGDPRAREELLLACLESGAEVLAVDPGPATAGTGPVPARAGAVRAALAAVRSHRTGSACL